MRNPLRSEADAFYLLVTVGLGAAAVIALTLLTRPLFGALLGLILVCLGAWAVYRAYAASKRTDA